MAGLVRRPVSGLALSVGLIAAVVGFGAWWTYFDFAGHRQPRSGRWPSLQWMLGHLPLTAAIAVRDFYGSVVKLQDLGHDRQSQSGMSLVLAIAAPEALEDELALTWLDAGAAILDPYGRGRCHLDFYILIWA